MKLQLMDLPDTVREISLVLPGGEIAIDVQTLTVRLPISATPVIEARTSEVVEAFRAYQVDERGLTKATVDCYQAVLLPFAQHAPEWPPTGDQVREFVRDWRARKVSPTTFYEYWVRLNTWFGWSVQQGLAQSNPMHDLTKPKAPHTEAETISTTDLVQVIQYLREKIADSHPGQSHLRHQRAVRDLAIIRFAYASGCRAAEICALQVRDLRLEERKAIIRAEVSKSGRRREVMLGRKTCRAMDAWLEVRPAINDQVFVGARGNGWSKKPMTRSGMYTMWRTRQKEAGIGPYAFHEFRHSHVTHSLDNGIPIHHVSAQAGHSSPDITARIYSHSRDPERIKAYDQANPDDRLEED